MGARAELSEPRKEGGSPGTCTHSVGGAGA